MDDLQTMATNALARQAFSQLLGAELVSISPGNAELALTITDSLKQQHGFLHGGVVSYLADNALTFAGGSVLGNCVTLEMKINYLKPAVGERVVATAKLVSASKRRPRGHRARHDLQGRGAVAATPDRTPKVLHHARANAS
jgi:uncharacterized protein (TIGR00369 family)